jgi:hypothetical protein
MFNYSIKKLLSQKKINQTTTLYLFNECCTFFRVTVLNPYFRKEFFFIHNFFALLKTPPLHQPMKFGFMNCSVRIAGI